MSNPTQPPDDLSPAESNLGKVLALIHRVLPRLDDPARKAEVQSALGKAASLLEAARAAHSGGVASLPPIGAQQVATAQCERRHADTAGAPAAATGRPWCARAATKASNAWALVLPGT